MNSLLLSISARSRKRSKQPLSNNVPKRGQEERSCDLCSLNFKSMNDYQRHMKTDEHCFRDKYRINK